MANCANCGIAIPEGRGVVIPGKDKKSPNVILCSGCAQNIEQAFQAETEGANPAGGLLFGLGAAIVSSLVWYGVVVLTKYELGILAVGVGWLVGQAVMLGAGRKRSTLLQVMSVAITVAAMVSSEYLIVRYFVAQALAERGVTDLALLLPLNLVVEMIIEGIKASPLTLLFWAIAVWQAFVIPAPRRLKRVN